MVMAVWTRVSMPFLLQEVLQRKAVHHGAEHAHVVGAGPVHALLLQFGAAEEVAAADDDGHLDTRLRGFGDLPGDALDDVGRHADAAAAEDLTGQLEQHPAVARCGGDLADVGAARVRHKASSWGQPGSVESSHNRHRPRKAA
jgi:hypothetical protein